MQNTTPMIYFGLKQPKVKNGIRKVVESSFILNAVRQEMSLATEVPVLIAIDEVDSLYLKSIYAYKQVDLWPSNLAGVRPFQIFDLTGLSNVAKPVNGLFMSPKEAVDINPFEEKLYCENDYSKNWDIVNCKIKFYKNAY